MKRRTRPRRRVVRLLIAGEAGQGILTAGDILFEAAAAAGYEASLLVDYPSNIRGGVASALVSIAAQHPGSPCGRFDAAIVLSASALDKVDRCANKAATVLVDSGDGVAPPGNEAGKGPRYAGIPLTDLAGQGGAKRPARNMAALGVCCALLDIDAAPFRDRIRARWAQTKAAATGANVAAFEAGRAWALDNGALLRGVKLPDPAAAAARVCLEGNQAVALGALAAGCTFFASYPITPATSIGNYLARWLPQAGGVAFQAEDEIGALGAVLGASFSGVKAMTATSGPGLSLMQELIGYSSMARLPAVIVDVQRAGPATGMPTKHEQADLMAAALGGHGDGPRIVAAPLNVEDSCRLVIEAFNQAQARRCPVIILTDAALASIKTTMPRASVTPSQGQRVECAPRPGVYRVTGVEHDEQARPVSDPADRERLMRERRDALTGLEDAFSGACEWDLASTGRSRPLDIGVVAWGLTAWTARHAVKRLREEGCRIAALYPRLLFPVCEGALNRLARIAKGRLVVVEANQTGQYARLVRMATGIVPRSFGCCGGEPFTEEDLVERLAGLIGRLRRRA